MPEPGASTLYKSTNVRTAHAAQAGWRAVFALLARWAPEPAAALAERKFFRPPQQGRRRSRFPAGAEPVVVRAEGGGHIAAWRWGRAPFVAFVHGWGGWGGQLAAFAAPLMAEGLGVVGFDGPGHGRSSGRLSSIPEFARALRGVGEAVGPFHGLVAHSLGAAAAAVALRDGLSVRRVVFVAPPADPAAWTSLFARRLGIGRDVMARMRARSERRLRFSWDALPVPPLVSGMGERLLVVHDREDGNVPWSSGAAVAAAAGAPLLTTDGLGHHRILRHPAITSVTAAFLARGAVPEETTRTGGGAVCETPGCGRIPPGSDALCASCALERQLFVRELRWTAAADSAA